MRAPNAPPTTPSPPPAGGLPLALPPEGASADQIQYARARQAWFIANQPPAATQGPLGGRPLTVDRADIRSPQQFQTHPHIRELAGGPAIHDVPSAHLPGRLPP